MNPLKDLDTPLAKLAKPKDGYLCADVLMWIAKSLDSLACDYVDVKLMPTYCVVRRNDKSKVKIPYTLLADRDRVRVRQRLDRLVLRVKAGGAKKSEGEGQKKIRRARPG